MRFTNLAVAAAALASAGAAQAVSLPYTSLYVFGDSLVDTGNAQSVRPDSRYVDGRYSNGNNFADYVSLGLGLGRSTAYVQGGTNFAVGGARTAEFATDESKSFAEQIDYLSDANRTISSDALVLLTFGGNDVRGVLQGGPTSNLGLATAALKAGIVRLQGLGARNIVVTGLPDIGQIPEARAANGGQPLAAGTQLSISLNEQFRGVVGDLGGSAAGLQFFDLFAYQKLINANPAAYGLPANLDMANPCLGTTAAPTCDGYTYYDTIHPTTQLHRAIGNGILAQLSATAALPEPATWTMLILGFGAVGGALRRTRRLPALAA